MKNCVCLYFETGSTTRKKYIFCPIDCNVLSKYKLCKTKKSKLLVSRVKGTVHYLNFGMFKVDVESRETKNKLKRSIRGWQEDDQNIRLITCFRSKEL